MLRIVEQQIAEPTVWNVVFRRDTTSRWIGMLPGRYKHVSAYAYVPGPNVWLFYDVQFQHSALILATDGEAAHRMIWTWLQNADVIKMRRQGGCRGARLGFYCVPAIKHLLGLRSGALLPDGLFKDCLAAGGEPFEGFDGARAAEIRAAAGERGVQAAQGAG
jgi:hypothetical protein